jgi:hypothetical protein
LACLDVVQSAVTVEWQFTQALTPAVGVDADRSMPVAGGIVSSSDPQPAGSASNNTLSNTIPHLLSVRSIITSPMPESLEDACCFTLM